MNAIRLDPAARTVTVGAGATWHAIQHAIHPDFAVKAMQSTDIFTVGGSISVNAHGMDHQAGAVMGSIRRLQRDARRRAGRHRVARARMPSSSATSSAATACSGDRARRSSMWCPTTSTAPNAQRDRLPRTSPTPSRRSPPIPAVGLSYAHLSTAPGSLLDEALVYRYRAVPGGSGADARAADRGRHDQDAAADGQPRQAQHASPRTLKWWAEKNLEHRIESCTVTRAQAMGDGEACLVSRNDPMHDSVAYLSNALPGETDILHEYFVPRDRILPFIDGMRTLFRAQDANLVNASIRVVGRRGQCAQLCAAARLLGRALSQPADRRGGQREDGAADQRPDRPVPRAGRAVLPAVPAPLHARRSWRAPIRRSAISSPPSGSGIPAGRFSNTWYARYAPAFAREAAGADPALDHAAARPPRRARATKPGDWSPRAIVAPRRTSITAPPAARIARTAAPASPITATSRPAGPTNGIASHDRASSTPSTSATSAATRATRLIIVDMLDRRRPPRRSGAAAAVSAGTFTDVADAAPAGTLDAACRAATCPGSCRAAGISAVTKMSSLPAISTSGTPARGELAEQVGELRRSAAPRPRSARRPAAPDAAAGRPRRPARALRARRSAGSARRARASRCSPPPISFGIDAP